MLTRKWPAAVVSIEAVLAQRGDAIRDRAGGRQSAREARGIDAVGEPQAHQQKFVGHFFARKHVVGDEPMAVGLDAREPGFGAFFRRGGVAFAGDVEATNVQSTMSAGSDAGIFLGAPVDEIMPALAAGPGVVGDFVRRQAVRGADLLRRVVERARVILVGHGELAGRM